MKQPTLLEIVKQITYQTGLTQGDIAEKIGYTRPYLNRAIHGRGENLDRLFGRLRTEFPDIVNPMYTTTTAKPSQVVKTQKDDQLTQRVESLEKRVAEIEAQLKVIISLLRK